MHKIGELNTIHGTFEIKYDEKDRCNPYKLYAKWYDGGYHRKLLVKYGDLYSCTLAIADYIKTHNETERRTQV